MVKARLVFRTDSPENWDEQNPVLMPGEPGYDYQNNVLKIGNGATPWQKLPGISDLKVATSDHIGGVLSSEEIKVEEDGTMKLNKVSTTLLYVPEDDELTINGGAL